MNIIDNIELIEGTNDITINFVCKGERNQNKRHMPIWTSISTTTKSIPSRYIVLKHFFFVKKKCNNYQYDNYSLNQW
jgi:hypothetical protein